MARQVEYFGTAVTAQKVSSDQTHGTEVFTFHLHGLCPRQGLLSSFTMHVWTRVCMQGPLGWRGLHSWFRT